MGKIIKNEANQVHLFWFWSFAAIAFLVFLLFNFKTGYINDDYTYRFIFEYWRTSPNPVRVTSISDIVEGMKAHYAVWGGRIPVHFTIQFFLMFEKWIFNFCNTVMIILLGVLIYFHSNFGKKRNLHLFILVFLMLWFLVPAANETILMLTNSINHLWVGVYLLIFLLPYRILMDRDVSFKHENLLSALMIPAGLLAGWSNENGAGATGLMILFVIFFLIKKKRKPPIWAFTGLVSVAIGLAVMIVSPGYQFRALDEYDTNSVLRYALENFKDLFKSVFQQTFQEMWPLFLLVAVFFLILYRIRQKKFANSRIQKKAYRHSKAMKDNRIDPLTLASFYLICAFSAFAIYVISPAFVLRDLFESAIFFMITAGILASVIIEEINIKHSVRMIFSVLLVLICSVTFLTDAVFQYRVCTYNLDMQKTIAENVKSQVGPDTKNVTLEGEYRILTGGRFNIYKLGWASWIFWGKTDPDFEINQVMAATYGVDTYINDANIYYVDAKDHFKK